MSLTDVYCLAIRMLLICSYMLSQSYHNNYCSNNVCDRIQFVLLRGQFWITLNVFRFQRNLIVFVLKFLLFENIIPTVFFMKEFSCNIRTQIGLPSFQFTFIEFQNHYRNEELQSKHMLIRFHLKRSDSP